MRKFLLFLLFVAFCSDSAFAYITQTDWRWRNDDGDQESATWAADLNNSIEILNESTDPLRLRIELVHKNSQEDVLDATLWLEYSTSGDLDDDDAWTVISDNEANAFVFASSSSLTDDEPTIPQLTSQYSEYSFVPGRVLEHQTQNIENESTDKAVLNYEERSEYVYTIKPTGNAEKNTTYYFKIQSGEANKPLPSLTFVDDIVTKPVVSITSPAEGATFTAPAEIVIEAEATSDEGISEVEFYNGETLLGTTTESPFTYTWNGVAAGTYTITTKAISNNNMTNSASVSVTVEAESLEVPTVSITSPAGGATFTTTEDIVITAEASAEEGISKVEFYNGETLLGTATESPYEYTWINPPVGNIILTAVAIGNNTATSTSSPIEIQINVTTGIFDDIKKDDGGAYPNPFKDHILIPVNVEKSGMVTIQILNLKGQVIYSEEFHSSPGKHYFKLEPGSVLSTISSGYYFYKIISNGEAKTGKILKNKE